MAQYLPLPDGSFVTVREGEQPADAWERAQRDYPAAFGIEPQAPAEAPAQRTTFGGQAKEFLKGIPTGAINMLESAGTGAAALLPDAAEKSVRSGIADVAAAARTPFTADAGYEDSVGSKFGQATGSFLPFLAAGPFGVAGRVGAAGLGVGAGAGEARVRAEGEGATEDQRGTATLLGAGVGLSEIFAPFRILSRVPDSAQATGVNLVRRALQAGGEEAAQEAAAGWAQNLIAQQIYKPEQELIEGLGEQAAYGGAVGALAQGVMDLALGRRARAAAATEEEQRAQEAQRRAAAEQERIAQGQIEAERDAPSAIMPETGAAQGSLPGFEGTPDAGAETDAARRAARAQQLAALEERTPEQERELQSLREQGQNPVQRAGFLRNVIPQIDARMDEIRQANLSGATLAERTERERKMEQLRQARSLAEQELKALALPDPGQTQAQIVKLQKQLQKADEAGDTAKALKIAEQIEALGGAQGALELGTPRRVDIEGNNQRAFAQMTKAELAQRDALLRAQRPSAEDTRSQDLLGALDEADQMRYRGNQQYELDQIERLAGGAGTVTQQPRLFGEPEETARVATGAGGTARSEAEIRMDLDIAKAARDRTRVSDLVDELRAVRDASRSRAEEGKAAQTDVSQLRSKELEQTTGMRVPEDAARRQSLTDARYRSFGQMVSTLERFNRGRADAAALRAAEQGVIDNLVREIDALTGDPMTTMERQSVMAEARDLLFDLKSRFGDTREEVNVGTRKKPQFEPVQRRSGEFRTDLPAAGAGPTGMGLENFETQDSGARTFSNRYAAAQSILEGLDQIRNRRAGTQASAPGVDRTDSNRSTEERLGTAVQQARGTPAAPLLQQVQDSNVKTPALVDAAVEAAMRAQRGQDIAEQQRAIEDELRRLEEGKRSETEGGRTAVQTDLFGRPGVVFNSYEEFEQFLASDALDALKMAHGQTRETLARAIKMVEPMQKKAAELEKQVQALAAQRAKLAELNETETAVARAQREDAEMLLLKAQADMDFAVADYRDAVVEAQAKLQKALDEDAALATQIADNLKQLDAVKGVRERDLAAARRRQTELIGLSRELAKAKEALAANVPPLFSQDDPTGSAEWAKYVEIENKAAELQKRLLRVSTVARDATTGIKPLEALAEFQRRADDLFQQRKQHTRRVAGLTSARNRAQRKLDEANALAQADPVLSARLADAKSIQALTRAAGADAERNVASRNTEIAALDSQIAAADTPARQLRRTAQERIAEARGKKAPEKPAGPDRSAEPVIAREVRDGERRRVEQAQLETRQEGPGTTRERVSFEPRRQDQEALEEANKRMKYLEDVLAAVPMDAEQRAKFEKAAAEYKERADKLTKRANTRLDYVTNKLNAQRDRIAMIQRAQARYEAAPVGSKAREDAQKIIAREMEMMQRQGRKISEAWGVQREKLMAVAEQREQKRRPADAEERIAEIAAGQTPRRTTSPAMRETRAGAGFRTGDPETQEQRQGAARTRIVESQRVRQRDVPMRAAEMAEANANEVTAKRLKEEARAANKAAAAQRRKSPERKKQEAAEAAAIAEEAARSNALWVGPDAPADRTTEDEVLKKDREGRQDRRPKPPSRTQRAIDDMALWDDDGAAREDNTYYESRTTTDLSESAAEAAFDGRILDVLDDIAANSESPFHQELAKALRPFLLRTKIAVKDGLRLKGRRAEGIYRPAQNEILLDSMALSEETTLHEMVHAATMRAIEGDVDLDPAQTQALVDLQRLYDQAKNDPVFKNEYAKKDLLEFTAELMTNPAVRDKLDQMAAGQTSLLQRMYTAILRMLGVSRTYSTATSSKAVMDTARLFMPSRPFEVKHAAVPSIMRGVFPGTKEVFNADVPQSLRAMSANVVGRDPTLVDKVMANVSGIAFRTQFIDRFAPVERLLKMGVAKGIVSQMQAFQTNYFLRYGEQRNQFVEQAANVGVPQLIKHSNGEFTIETPDRADQPNLGKIAEALSKANVGNEQATERLFTNWLAVLRAETPGVGYNKLNTDQQITPQMAAELKAFVAADPARSAAFESARKMYREYNNSLLDLMTQTGAMAKDEAARLKKGDYVPYYREEGGVVQLIVAGEKPVRIGNIAEQPYLKELVGDNNKILPFFTGAMQNTSMLIDMALRNQQTKDVSMVLRSMHMATIGRGDGPTDTRDIVRFKIDGENHFARIEKATEEFGVPAELLVQGMQGIKTTLPAFLQALQYPSNLLRKMITRAPAYALRQIIREPINAWLTTGGNFTPIASSVGELTRILQGKSTAAKTLERTGAVSSNVITGDIQDQARILRDIAQGKTAWDKVMMAADKFAMQGDTATRAVLYDKFRAQGMTHMQALLGSLESMNFMRRGLSPSMQMMSMLVPFFNAQVQGMDVIYRAMKGDATLEEKLDVRRKLFKRGLMISAGTVAYALLMGDDEAYKNATPEQRALNWFVRVPGFDEPLRVPIPFELGYIFKVLPEMFINVASEDVKSADAVKAFGGLLYQTIPFGMPQAIKPAVEVMANYSFYTGEGVESRREQTRDPSQRFRDNTTELAKLLGQTGLASPVQIDYLIRGYTGGLGLAIASIPNFALRPLNSDEVKVDPTMRASQMPLLGALFQPNDGRAVIDEAFKDVEQFQRAHNTFNDMLSSGRRADAMAYAQRYSNEIALNQVGGQFRQQMGELAQVRRALMARTDITPQEKRDQLDRLRKIEIALAQRVREAADRPS